jgi:serpin B
MEDTLAQMGMPTSFIPPNPVDPCADFSGMNGGQELFISRVIHQAYVLVNEKGTEAAAATAVIGEVLVSLQWEIFNADRPFIFVIRDIKTNTILFVGRIMNPAS